MNQWSITPKSIIELPKEIVQLPNEIYVAMLERHVQDFDFFFVCNDTSQIIKDKKNNTKMNLIHHTWIHPNIEMGSRLGNQQ